MDLLKRASRIKNRDQAVGLIRDALKIEVPLAYRFSDQQRWEQLPPSARLGEIEHWLIAECRKAMDLVPGLLPMETVGTND